MFGKRRASKARRKHEQLQEAGKVKVRERLDSTDWLKVLSRIEEHKSYYAGGGLCVDLPEGAFGLHLSGRVVEFGTGETKKMTDAERQKVFAVYKKYKGETGFYRTNFSDYMKGK